jgi:flagellar hook-basal body protein
MGIYGALSSAVTGLRAQAHSLENISGNIANSQTTGYKRIETDFLDLIPDAPVSRQVPGAVLAQSRSTNDVQGDIKTVTNQTFVALNGNGFFVVEPTVGQSDGQPVFAGTNFYTRRGDFEIDKAGRLVNGAGYYLKGLDVDPGTGNVSGSVPKIIEISNAFLEARPSTAINYGANLPQLPKTVQYKPATLNSELMKPWTYSNPSPLPVFPAVSGLDIPNAVHSSVPARATGAGPYEGSAAASNIVNDGDMISVEIGDERHNLWFDTNGIPSSAIRFISGTAWPDSSAAVTTLHVDRGDLAGLNRAGEIKVGGSTIPFAAPAYPASGAGLISAIQAALPCNSVSYDEGSGKLTIEYPPGARLADTSAHGVSTMVGATSSIDGMLATIQTELRELSGDSGLWVKLKNGQVTISLGPESKETLAFSSSTNGPITGNVLGLSGSHSHIPDTVMTAENTYADLIVNGSDTLVIKVGGTTRSYSFDIDGRVAPGPGQVEIDATGSLADMLAAIQADLRANGGIGAANAIVSYGSEGVRVAFPGNYYYDADISGSAADKMVIDGIHTASPGQVQTIRASDSEHFLSETISGGAVTVYASNGAPANLQLRWAKLDSAAADGHDIWNLYYMSNSSAVGAETMWTRVNENFQFATNGSLVSPTTGATTLTELNINGVALGDVEFRYDTNGLSQFADVNGTANVSTLNQDGYGAGEFVSVAINDNGRVVATYSNGERIDMAQVVTAQFNATNKLKRSDGGVFISTSESGEPILDLSGSGVIGGSLEASNTDISDEFTKLIVTQQAYAAGTRIVSTADEMLQESLNMVR